MSNTVVDPKVTTRKVEEEQGEVQAGGGAGTHLSTTISNEIRFLKRAGGRRAQGSALKAWFDLASISKHPLSSLSMYPSSAKAMTRLVLTFCINSTRA